MNKIKFIDDITVATKEVLEAYDFISNSAIEKRCFFDLDNCRRIGYAERNNAKTVWVKVVFGCNTMRLIKRHKIKHNVKFY